MLTNRRCFLFNAAKVAAAVATVPVFIKLAEVAQFIPVEQASPELAAAYSSLDLSNILKEIYSDKLEAAILAPNPFLALIPKTEFDGLSYPLPLQYKR